jgi:hypothetical protein
VKIYYKSKKKHSKYIMKVLIIILIILICFIIIKSNYESFDNPTTQNDDIDDILEELSKKYDQDIIIQDKITEYRDLKAHMDSKKNKFDDNVDELQKRYNNTKIQLENILFNKLRPNRLDFNEKHQKFKLRVNSFMSDLNGGDIKMTHYGSIDTDCNTYNWKLPDNVPFINTNQDATGNALGDTYFNKDSKCCNIERDECIAQYKKNVTLSNEYKVVLKNQNNKHLELNKIKDNIYLVNLNSQILNYKCNTDGTTTKCTYNSSPILTTYKSVIDLKPELCFKLIEIKDLIHLNQFILNEKLEDDLFEYPFYLLIPLEENNKAITIHSKNALDGERLSIQPLSKEMIAQQIFYKN